MAVNWEWYVRRVSLNVEEWLLSRGIKNYGTFVEVLKKQNISPPLEEDVKHYFDTLFPSKEKVQADAAEKKWGIVENKPAKKKKKTEPTVKKSSTDSEPVEDSLYHDG